MIKTYASAALILTLSTVSVSAQEDPWGGNVPGWRFTQAGEANGVTNCLAKQGPNIISLRSTGKTYVSVQVPAGLPKGSYKEGHASIVIGNTAEPVDAAAGGAGERLVFYIDSGLYPSLIQARGYQWRVNGPRGIQTGSVAFSGDLGKVIAELRACVKANTPAPQSQQATPPKATAIAKWSGDWVWIRPLVLFGAPVDTKGQRLSIELTQNDHVNICVDLRRNDSCKNVPFTQKNGVYSLSPSGSELYEIQYANGGLSGQFWWKKENRARTGPDGTFYLR